MEPPRAQGARRRPTELALTQLQARRIARPVAYAAADPVSALPDSIRTSALVAGGALTAAGRADFWTLAIAFGVADASAITSLVVLLAGVATIARAGSAGLAEVAGSQAVLGAAGFTGSAVAIAAAWTSAVSLVLSARDQRVSAALGALGGLLVAGPSLAGGFTSIATWIAGVGLGGVAGWFAAGLDDDGRWKHWVAVGVGVGAVSLGLLAGYR